MDVNFALKVEAWASALGYTVDSTGHVEARILRALRQIAGVSGYGGLMHFNNEVLTLLSQIAAAAGGGGAGVVGLLAASGISAGSTYEVTAATDPGGPGILQLKRVGNFPTSRTIAAASPEYGWTWDNRTTWGGTADDNTTNAGWSTWAFSTTSVLWFSGTRSAPFRYRTFNVERGDDVEIICRVASNASRNYELAGPMIHSDSDPVSWSRILAGYDSGIGGTNIGVRVADSSNLNGAAALTSTNCDAGIWLRMRWSSTSVSYHYHTSTSSTPPTSGWTSCGTGALTGAGVGWGNNVASTTYRIGMLAQNENTSGGFVVKFGWFTVKIAGSVYNLQPWMWGTELFNTSATEQLVGEMDFGSAVELDQTKLRQVLADAVNTRPCDSATVTFSVVGGSSSGPASSTYYAAGSVVVSGSYRYWRVYAKITSATGAEQGSIKLPLLLPPSVA